MTNEKILSCLSQVITTRVLELQSNEPPLSAPTWSDDRCKVDGSASTTSTIIEWTRCRPDISWLSVVGLDQAKQLVRPCCAARSLMLLLNHGALSRARTENEMHLIID